MAPKFIMLVRHGEAEHNIDDDFSMPDPKLTEKGVAECQDLGRRLQAESGFAQGSGLIVVSPLRRTIESAHYAFKWLMDRNVPNIVRAEWQETAGHPCDIGTAAAVMKEEWPQFNWHDVENDPIYPDKKGIYKSTEEAYLERAAFAKQWMFERPEDYIIVMTHSGFLKRAVGGPRLENVEYKLFDFDETSGPPILRQIGGCKPSELVLAHQVDLTPPGQIEAAVVETPAS